MSSMASDKGTVNRAVSMKVATLAMMLALVVGCSSGDPAAPPASAVACTGAPNCIGSAGGTATGPDGVTVVFPPGALNQPTAIGIARSSAGAPLPLQEGNAPVGPVYEFTPHDLVFNAPVTIRVPVPPGAVSSEVFMASLGADWQVNDATIVNGFAEWQRNSFSWSMFGGGCSVSPAIDPYACVYPGGYATVSATPASAITRRTFSNPFSSAGSWVVNHAGTVTLTLNYGAAPDCSDANAASPTGHVRLLRFNNLALPLNTPGRITTLFDETVALTVTPVTLPPGLWSTGGGSTFRGTGSTTVDVSSYLTDATNAFGFSFTCHRPGRSQIGGGDLVTIIGPMPAPSATFTIGGTVSGLTGTGLVLQNGTENRPVSANGLFTFATAIAAGAPYSVTVQTQPSSQTCTVLNGSGTASVNVTNVAVTCVGGSAPSSAMNDTGITASQCYQAGSNALVSCASGGATALSSTQDGMRGRDADPATNGAADGKLGFSFSKIDAAGQPLSASATGWSCVKDNVTGLMWEVKTADGGLRDWNTRYSNYDSTTQIQDGGAPVTQAVIDAATNSVGFKNAVNTVGLCGASDWRMPTSLELSSLVDYGAVPPTPVIDSAWFPNTKTGEGNARYFTSSPIGDASLGVGFDGGYILSSGRHSFYVRLVRAAP